MFQTPAGLCESFSTAYGHRQQLQERPIMQQQQDDHDASALDDVFAMPPKTVSTGHWKFGVWHRPYCTMHLPLKTENDAACSVALLCISRELYRRIDFVFVTKFFGKNVGQVVRIVGNLSWK